MLFVCLPCVLYVLDDVMSIDECCMLYVICDGRSLPLPREPRVGAIVSDANLCMCVCARVLRENKFVVALSL